MGKKIILTLILAIVKLLKPICRCTRKKKYDYILYFDGHLGDYILCHGCFEQLTAQNKTILLISTVSFDKKLNELFGIFTDVIFLKSKSDYFFIPWKVTSDIFFEFGWNVNLAETVFAGLFFAKKKVKFMRQMTIPNSRLNNIDNKSFTRVIESQGPEVHLCKQIAMALSQAFDAKIEAKLTDLRPLAGEYPLEKPYFVVNTSVGGNEEKIWPIERFAALTDYCAEKTGFRCVYVGPKSAYPIGNDLGNMCCCNMENIAGKTSLSELLSVVANAEFVIGNDTGTSHLAALSKVDSFSILMTCVGNMFLPYPKELCDDVTVGIVGKPMECKGCSVTCINPLGCMADDPSLKRYRCIELVSVQDAIDAIEETGILEKHGNGLR